MILVIGPQVNLIMYLLKSNQKVKVIIPQMMGILSRFSRLGLELIIGDYNDLNILFEASKDVEFIITRNKINDILDKKIIYITDKNDELLNQMTIQIPFMLENLLSNSTFFPNRKLSIIDINQDIKIKTLCEYDLSKFLDNQIKNYQIGVYPIYSNEITLTELLKKIKLITNVDLKINFNKNTNFDYILNYQLIEGISIDQFIEDNNQNF